MPFDLNFNNLFFIAIGLINLTAFLIMMVDKMRSRKHGAERISEGKMFFMATIFGSVGVYLGMFIFHHKNRKWHFVLGIPLLMIQNAACLYLLYQNFLG